MKRFLVVSVTLLTFALLVTVLVFWLVTAHMPAENRVDNEAESTAAYRPSLLADSMV